jgi:hypothetical protein
VIVTPALAGQPQAAAARSIDPVEEAAQAQNGGAAEGATDIGMAWSIFDLSVAEKLKLGGRRIAAYVYGRVPTVNPPSRTIPCALSAGPNGNFQKPAAGPPSANCLTKAATYACRGGAPPK